VLASGVSLCGVSIPNFWLGIMLILLVSVRLGWLPASGFVAVTGEVDEDLASPSGVVGRERTV
jgi:peptide/nickel transport system permease protein